MPAIMVSRDSWMALIPWAGLSWLFLEFLLLWVTSAVLNFGFRAERWVK